MSRPVIHYGRSDRKVMALLAVVAAVLVCTGVFFGRRQPSSSGATDARGDSARNVVSAEKRPFHREKVVYYDAGSVRPELFPFDPNTADSTALLRLGLRPWQVRNIYKYRAKGGVYRRPADFARLYGLTAGQYKALEPYIRISRDFMPASSLVEEDRPPRDTLRYPVKIGEGEHIVLNTADTSQLKRVPGIGSGFARAIIAYGERLGGYVSVGQLDEIDGFPAEAKKYFVVSGVATRKLNLNKCTLNQLKRHPYISFFQAKAIVDYRRLHGKLNSIDDLRLHRDFNDEARHRLEPYVEF